MNSEQQQQCLRASCLPLAYLVESDRRTRTPTGMENLSESACFYWVKDCFWCIAEPEMIQHLTPEQHAAFTEFESIYQSLPWRALTEHPHISELPDDDLSALVPAGQCLLRLISPPHPQPPLLPHLVQSAPIENGSDSPVELARRYWRFLAPTWLLPVVVMLLSTAWDAFGQQKLPSASLGYVAIAILFLGIIPAGRLQSRLHLP